MSNSFAEGVEAIYKDHRGHIKFICPEYVTLCIHSNPDPMKDVCIVIHKCNWDIIHLIRESTK